MHTQMGLIAQMLQALETEPTPLQRRLEQLLRARLVHQGEDELALVAALAPLADLGGHPHHPEARLDDARAQLGLDADAHRLWRSIFGMCSSRHLTVNDATLDQHESQEMPAGGAA